MVKRILALSLLVSLAGCAREATVDLPPPRVPPDKTVATVNGEPLSLEEFDSEMLLMRLHYSAVTEGQMRAIKRRLFEQVINRRLLVQEARRLGLRLTQSEAKKALREPLKDDPENIWAVLKVQGVSEGAWKRKLLQERLAQKLVDVEVNSKVQITPQETEDYYWTHLTEYWRPPAVRARHLIVQRKGDLDKVLRGLSKGEDFQRLVSTFSAGPDKSHGGDWGFMDTDRLSADYLKALDPLKPGEVSKPLKDEIGYHLFQLVGRRNRQMKPFAEVRKAIHDGLMKEEQDLRFDEWMSGLKKKAAIKVNRDMAALVGVNLEDQREE